MIWVYYPRVGKRFSSIWDGVEIHFELDAFAEAAGDLTAPKALSVSH